MTDKVKNLLELAAKAAGYVLPSADDHDEIGRQYEYNLGLWVKFPWGWNWFRPHIDDGQALRLAVKLNMNFTLSGKHAAVAQCGEFMAQEFCNGDSMAATRRAIVRAAAEIGSALVRTADKTCSQKPVDPIIQMIRDQAAEKAALVAKGICPTCNGEGECGGQFTGGERVCEDCEGSGRYQQKL